MRRRAFLTTLVGGAAMAWTAVAQQSPPPRRIGYVGFYSAGAGLETFRTALAKLGYAEGPGFSIETRFALGRAERLPAIMAELLGMKVEVLVVASTQTALAAKRATSEIPIVFASVFDPVGSGLVSSLARPGGNITGAAIGVSGAGLGGKWLELLREVSPALSHVAVLANPANPASAASLLEIEAAAQSLGVRVDALDAGTDDKLVAALAQIDGGASRGLIVTNDPLLTPNAERIAAFAAGRRLPAVYFFSLFAQAGGLMSYGASTDESYRRAAAYVDRILRGAKPASLPVEQPTQFHLVVNLRAAANLAITIPESLLARADEVIE